MSNVEYLTNVTVQTSIDAVEQGVDLVPVVADSTLTAKIALLTKQPPGRPVNVGIAEQSTAGTAAGLTLGGKVVVTYNTAPFLISRVSEQIKVDVCYNDTNVKLFGLNAGAGYGPLVSTRHSIDDTAIMRSSGSIQIFAPSSPRKCRQIIDYAVGYQGPICIRLDEETLPELHDESYRFASGVMLTLRRGGHVALVATSSTVHEIADTAALLANTGIQAEAVSVSSIRPCDTKALLSVLQGYKAVITVGEHNTNGGLGSLVAEVLAEARMGVILKRLGVPDGKYAAAADRGWLCRHHGFSAAAIVALTHELLWILYCRQCNYSVIWKTPLHTIRLVVCAEDRLITL